MRKRKILVMGVSGTGKSLIGSLIAKALDIRFIDGDDFHSQQNLDKMSRGIPLTDNDREWWLKTLNYQFISSNSIVVACSALKHEYRCLLKENNQNLIVVYLKGSFATILDRHQKRKNHFFNGKSMLKSQFDTLVEPAEGEAIFIDIDQSVETVVVQALKEIDKLHWQACKLQDVRW